MNSVAFSHATWVPKHALFAPALPRTLFLCRLARANNRAGRAAGVNIPRMQQLGDDGGSGDYGVRGSVSTGPPTGEEIEADAREISTAELKSELLKVVNGTNRGIDATKSVRANAVDLIKQLDYRGEVFDATENPEALLGTWRLVYTNALDILSLALLPFVRIGPIYQNVERSDDDRESSSSELKVTNIVDLSPPFAPVLDAFDAFGPTVTRIRVTARGTIASSNPRRVDIVFVKSAVESVSLFGLDVSQLPKLEARVRASAAGYIETTYVDDELRIARAPPSLNAPNVGNYFVLLRK